MFTLYSFCDIITVQRRRIGKERTPYALEMKMNISKRMDKMKKNNKRINRNDISEFLMLSAGAVLTAAGVYFFKIPNGFSTGGFSGLSILLGELIAGVNTSTFVTVLNLLSLVVGFAFLGRGVGWKTTYCTLLYTGTVNLFEWLYPMTKPLTEEIVLELIFASLLGAIGAALVFKCGGSTGGTDILALVFRKYTSADIIKTYLVQTVVDSLNRRKSLMIITTAPHEITKFITETLHRSATIWDAQGAFTDSDKFVIFSAMTTYQAAKLKDFAKSVDEHAFVTINKTSEIYGKGFLPFGGK